MDNGTQQWPMDNNGHLAEGKILHHLLAEVHDSANDNGKAEGYFFTFYR